MTDRPRRIQLHFVLTVRVQSLEIYDQMLLYKLLELTTTHIYIDPKTDVNENTHYWGNINAIFFLIQLWFIAIDKKENEECIGIIFSIFKTKH